MTVLRRTPERCETPGRPSVQRSGLRRTTLVGHLIQAISRSLSPIRRRSSMNLAYSASLSSRTRRRKLGWTVTQASPPSSSRCALPRNAAIVTALPNKERAAVAPRATTKGGRISESSCWSHQRHAVIDAIMAVKNAGVGQQDLEQRDAAPVRRIGMADAHAGRGRADPLPTPAVALRRAGRGAGRVIFRGVGENRELLLDIELGHPFLLCS